MKKSADTPKNLEPKKHLGQVFLKDQKVIDRIVASCKLTKSDSVLEIGPGQGALTYKLAKAAQDIIAVETDKRFIENFSANPLPDNLTVLHADFLKTDLKGFPEKMVAVGNLPYNISSPIIQKLIENRSRFKSLFLTVQLEFGRRITANPGTKDYSALTCFVQYYGKPKMLFQIKRGSFDPVPKVDSCFMEIALRPQLETQAKDEALLFKIIRLAFQQRRKVLSNALSGLGGKEATEQLLAGLGIDGRLRPENIPLTDFVRIADALAKT